MTSANKISAKQCLLHVRKANPQLVANKQQQDCSKRGNYESGRVKTLVTRRDEHVGDCATENRSDDANDDYPENGEMNVHDRFCDHASD